RRTLLCNQHLHYKATDSITLYIHFHPSFFFFQSYGTHRDLHSFPTRRSSDLIRHNLSSSKGPKPLQLKLLTTYIPKTSAFTLAFSTSQRLRTTRASARTFFTFRHYITPSARNF